jgi:lipopolysaccharide export system protein LptA
MSVQLPLKLFQLMNKSKYLIVLTTFLFVSTFLASNGKFEIIHADKTIGKLINGEQVRILEGNIHAIQDTISMFCDRAVYYEVKNRSDFFGHVHIYDGHHKLWADTIIYYTELRIAHCLGNVRISGINDSLFSQKFIYRFKERNAQGEEDLFIWDKVKNARVWGDSGIYHSQEKQSYVYGNTRFEHNEKEKTDTLIITAKRMEYYGIEPRRALASDSVLIFKGNLTAKCDSAIYFVTDEKVSLKIEPVAWQQQNEMRGDVIDLVLDSLEIKEINITDKAHLISLADSLSEIYNHLRGKKIQVFLADGRPYFIVAKENASSIYMLKEKEKTQGFNVASSDSILIFFKQTEVDSIAFMGGAEGIFYPPDRKGELNLEY